MSNVLPESIASSRRALFTVCAALVLAGCASGTGTTSSAVAPSASATAPGGTSTTVARRPSSRPRAHPRTARSRGSGSLAYSTASNDMVQAQPPPSSCHSIGSGLYSRPDPACTPGALNPVVKQGTIDRTICVEGWTKTVRPPESITEKEKRASLASYGDSGPLSGYEYDHFVPLELGGATNDPRNLWPEPGNSPNPKDAVEDELRREVCDGRLSLLRAQHEIATNWVSLARRSPPRTKSPSPVGRAPVPAAECTLTASYSSRYDDYDVYVHSNQPDRTVTVTGTDGHSDSWHTDGAGYADVYFKSGGPAPGRHVTARVGQAICSTTL